MYYRIAIRGSHSALWSWKSPPFNSLHSVLEVIKLYRAMPQEHIRVFLFTATQRMDAMLKRANQGRLTTGLPVRQLWDAHHTNWLEVRRLEVELGEGGDHDRPSDGDRILSGSQVFAWPTLLARRASGELLC